MTQSPLLWITQLLYGISAEMYFIHNKSYTEYLSCGPNPFHRIWTPKPSPAGLPPHQPAAIHCPRDTSETLTCPQSCHIYRQSQRQTHSHGYMLSPTSLSQAPLLAPARAVHVPTDPDPENHTWAPPVQPAHSGQQLGWILSTFASWPITKDSQVKSHPSVRSAWQNPPYFCWL